MAVLLWSHALWLMSRCHALQPQAAYFYFNASYTASNETLGVTPTDSLLRWDVYPESDGRVENSEIRANVTQQKWFAALTYNGPDAWLFQEGRVSTLRMTIYGAIPTPADADLVISMTRGTRNYFSVMVPLNGNASTYNNSIGPECDTARVPNSTTRFYEDYAGTVGNADDTNDPLYTKVGARAAEMQPPSKVNTWPIVLEVENHIVEDYSIVRLQSGDSDVVQQCAIGQAFDSFANIFLFGGGDDGQYLALSGIDVEIWYNDTSSPTPNPTTTPTGAPTAHTAEPTTTPTQEPTGMPTQEPILTGAPSEDPTQNTTESSEDSGDDGLAIGLGVAGKVVVLLVLATVA